MLRERGIRGLRRAPGAAAARPELAGVRVASRGLGAAVRRLGQAGLTGPGEIAEEAVESPGAAQRIGARCLDRIAYRHEPALQSHSDVAGQAGGAEKALRHKQSPGHRLAAASPTIRLVIIVARRCRRPRTPPEANP